MEWLYLVSTIASSLAAVLAWAAKLWWGREFAAAKDEIIKAKEAQIELLTSEISSLKELTPMKIREYFLSVREQMEEYNNLLKDQLDGAHKQLENKTTEIERLKQEGEKSAAEVEKIEDERQRIAEAATKLEQQLSNLKSKYESDDVVVMRMPKIDAQFYEKLYASFADLSRAMSKNITVDMTRLSHVMIESSKITEQQAEYLERVKKYRNVLAHSSEQKQIESSTDKNEGEKSGKAEADNANG